MTEAFEDFDAGKLRLVLLEQVVVLEHVICPDQMIVQRDEIVDGYVY